MEPKKSRFPGLGSRSAAASNGQSALNARFRPATPAVAFVRRFSILSMAVKRTGARWQLSRREMKMHTAHRELRLASYAKASRMDLD
jgi:hypothetical protein